jgi:hypothetical protein
VYKNSSLVLETMWGSSHRAEEGFEYPVYLREKKNIYWLFIFLSVATLLAILASAVMAFVYVDVLGETVSKVFFISILFYFVAFTLCIHEVYVLYNLLKKYRADLALLSLVYGNIPFGAKAYNEMSREELQSALMDIFYFHVMRYQLDTSNEENEKELNKILSLLKRFGIINYNSGVGEYIFLRPLNPDEDISITIKASYLEGSIRTLGKILPNEILAMVGNFYFISGNPDRVIGLEFYEITKPVNLKDVHMRGFKQDEGTAMYFTLCLLKKNPHITSGKYGKEFLIWAASIFGTRYYIATLTEDVVQGKNQVSVKPYFLPTVKKGVRVVIVSI